jgi:hypothetical protein
MATIQNESFVYHIQPEYHCRSGDYRAEVPQEAGHSGAEEIKQHALSLGVDVGLAEAADAIVGESSLFRISVKLTIGTIGAFGEFLNAFVDSKICEEGVLRQSVIAGSLFLGPSQLPCYGSSPLPVCYLPAHNCCCHFASGSSPFRWSISTPYAEACQLTRTTEWNGIHINEWRQSVPFRHGTFISAQDVFKDDHRQKDCTESILRC